MKINFNEIRRLSKLQKTRPILQCLYIKDRTLYWTNSLYLLRLTNFNQDDGLIHVEDFHKVGGEYPPLEGILSMKDLTLPEWEQTIISTEEHGSKLVYIYNKERQLYIDEEIIKQIEKILSGYKFSHTDLKYRGILLRLDLDNVTLVFTGKKV